MRDWENEYTFHIKSPQPVTIVSATVEVYRVKFFQRHYTLSPTTDLETSDTALPEQEFNPPTQFVTPHLNRPLVPSSRRTPEWVPRPEFKTARIVLSNLRDEKQILPTVPLGQIDVYSNDTVSLTFLMTDECQNHVTRLRHSLVQLLAEVVFQTDKGALIRTEPFLVTMLVPWHNSSVDTSASPRPAFSPNPKNLTIPTAPSFFLPSPRSTLPKEPAVPQASPGA